MNGMGGGVGGVGGGGGEGGWVVGGGGAFHFGSWDGTLDVTPTHWFQFSRGVGVGKLFAGHAGRPAERVETRCFTKQVGQWIVTLT